MADPPAEMADALAELGDDLAAGRFDKALGDASRTCRLFPQHPEPHYAYGQAWSALGKHSCAARAFAEAVRLRPRWADAWVNYGVERYWQGSVGDAKAAMRQALVLSPHNGVALSNLAAFMRISGEGEEAEALLQAALARGDEPPGIRLNLAADLLQQGRADEALGLLDAAEAPDDPAAARHWWLQQALALLQVGRAGEAGASLTAFDALGPPPPELAPLRLWRGVLLAQAEGDPDAAGRLAGSMAEALDVMGPRAVPEHRVMGHYDLARFRSGRGERAEAFAHWSRAHCLLAPTQPFSRAAHAAFLQANVESFTADRFLAGPRAADRDPAPVFIVGMPRSGTTLCEQILAAHRNVHGAGERTALGRLFARLGGGGDESPDAPGRIAALGAATLDAEAQAFLADLHALAPDARRVVDKMPANALCLGLIGLMLPGARVIHCRRDPRDVGLSIFTYRFHGDHGYAHDLADLGWTITQRSHLMEHWARVLPCGVLTVDLTDWIDDFDGTLARVLDYLDLPHDPNCVRFHEREGSVRTVSRAQVRQPVNARGLGRWRLSETELAPLLAELELQAAGPAATF